MRILIIGSGGREHALAWRFSQSQRKPKIFIAPGNGGTALVGENIPIQAGDIPALVAFAIENDIDFVLPGPELPLVLGIVDACKKVGIPCFGPEQYAAQLEGSKAFTKRILTAAGVPTAAYEVFTDYEAARAYVQEKGTPIVIKADGLASGKGVVVAKTKSEALDALEAMMVKKTFGDAGLKVVIEEALVGEEISFLVFCQGDTVIPLPSAQDHKAAFDGDTGPNTGGMGAYTPAPLLPPTRYDEIIDLTIRPVLRQLEKEGHPFSGILYAGLMMTDKGPKVLEYNVRFGDPECQPLLMRFENDFLEVMLACVHGRLDDRALTRSQESAVCIVYAAEGYPGSYAKGMPITGIEEAEAVKPGKVKVFQAGTTIKNGQTVASGGRVLGITALGSDLAAAQALAYEAIKHIKMDMGFYRKDIGNKGLVKQ